MKDWIKHLTGVAAVAACTNALALDIHTYAQIGDVAKLEDLLTNNPKLVNDSNSPLGTPLHGASLFGKTEAAKLLLAYKADVNARDADGRTPLHWAKNKGIVEMLLAHNADIEARTRSGDTPLHSAVSTFGILEVAEALLEHKADVNAKNNNGHRPLDGAGRDPKMAELLRKHRAMKGAGAIHLAVAHGNLAEVKDLLSSQPEVVNEKWLHTHEGSTPIQMAVIYKHKEVLELLLAHKADVNYRDKLGRTALHRAIRANNEEAVRLLLAHKADVNIKDNEGRTPMDVASDKIATLLREHRAKSGKE